MRKTALNWALATSLLLAACSGPAAPGRIDEPAAPATEVPATAGGAPALTQGESPAVTSVTATAVAPESEVTTMPAAPTVHPTRTTPPNQGKAPELTNTVWINTDHPLRLQDLQAQGKVVMIDFWTFG